MKPDGVLLNDMDEVEVAPSEMFSRLGMLVVESRVPHPSAKGRMEGPHCPSSPGDGPHHQCRPQSSPICKRAEALQHQMHVLWKNHIPMCIEVLLYEDCVHGEQKANTLDVTMPSSADNYILLEQWTVQIVPRRGVEGQVRPRELFQALKSYLHFSQLSAWLNLTQGKAPRNVGYRISPPGEFCISTFKETPQWHTFPICTLANNAGVKVTMGCLPRRHDNQLLHVVCQQHHPQLQAHIQPDVAGPSGASGGTCAPVGTASRSSLSPLIVKPHDGTFRDIPQFVSPQRPHASMVPPKQQQQQQQQRQQPIVKAMPSSTGPMAYTSGKWPSEHRKKFDKRRSIQEVTQSHHHHHQSTTAPPMQSKPLRLKPEISQHKQQTLQDAYKMQRDFKTTTLDEIRAQEAAVAAALADKSSPLQDESSYLELQKQTGAIPKKLSHNKSSPALPLETHSAPDLDIFNTELGSTSGYVPTTSKSPKVLFTKKSPGQAYYHRDDAKWFLNSASCSDSADSDQSSPEIDKYLKNMKTKADPLSPEEIQSYLASLSIRNRKRQPSPLAKTPSPEFIDPNSQAVKDLTSIFSSFGDGSEQKQPSLDEHSDIPTTAKVSEKVDKEKKAKIEDSNGTECKKTVVSQTKPVKQTMKIQSRSRSPTRISAKQNKTAQQQQQQRLNETPSQEKDMKIQAKKSDQSHDELKEQGKVQPADSESEKVLFHLGDDHNEGDSFDDGDVKPRNAIVSQSEQITNGGCKDDKSAISSQVTTNGCHVTNGHYTDDLGEMSRDRNQGNRVVTPRQSAMKRSVSDSESLRRHLVDVPSLPGINKASPLYKTLMAREMSNINRQNDQTTCGSKPIPTPQERASFRKSLESSTNMIFHANTGLPLQSSPAPMKKQPSDRFDYDQSLNNPRAIKNSISCVNLDERNKNEEEGEKDGRFYSTSAPASTNCLLGNFEESLLNGRIEPSGVVEGFSAEIGASGNFCPKHRTLPVTAFFFNLSDDNAPSPYLGHVNLEMVGKRGYHIPKKGTVQVTLFNPNKTVVKMFVVVYDLTDMPANCQTFLRQRTLYMPVSTNRNTKPEDVDQPVYLRYLIHLRFQSSKSSKIYLHTDMRMIFARDKFEYDSRVANYELRSFTEAPTNPKFSPRR